MRGAVRLADAESVGLFRANRTLLWGGVLVIVSAVGQMAHQLFSHAATWQSRLDYLPNGVIPSVLLAALTVFAVGVRGRGVMGRSAVGKVALIGFGACNAYAGWFEFLGIQLTEPPAYGLIVAVVMGPVLAIVAVIVIAWKGALPGLWRFVPALVVAAVIARYGYAFTVSDDATTLVSLDASVIIAQLLMAGVALFLSFRNPTLDV
ncbi:hypothetical protein [Microbacterium sp.]|uniref:hypothetical protein n=1 Tax=Microbacterium sp. TaxID=51671 RepID=UPI003564C2DB